MMNAAIDRSVTSDNEQKSTQEPLDQELELLWQDCGQSGAAYDLYLSRISRSPVVRSYATGKYFMLPWSRIIELAIQRGIDEK
jgi:hypothetical protein